ncbi:MAG: hypothetical protein ACOYOT_03995 [Bacteroidales bacterium]
MNKLDDIKKQYGQKTPFSVPENYFEQFSEYMMAQLPEKEKKMTVKITMWKRVKPILYLAAMFTAAIWAVNLFVTKKPVVPVHSAVVVSAEQDAESVSLAMSVDDYSLYEYMNGEKETN